MRILALFLALALALVPLLPAASAAGMPQPAWSEGDTWFYAAGAANVTVTVGGLERVAAGTLANAWNVSTTAPGAPSQSHWYRDDDLARMRDAAGNVTYSFDAPCRELQFPLDVGKTWTTACARRGSDGSTQTLAGNWTVLREEDLAVPAGAFHAFVLEQRVDNGGGARLWWAPAACNVVRAETFNAQGQTLATSQLVSFHCAQAPDVPTPILPSPTPSPTPGTGPSSSPSPTTPSPSAGASPSPSPASPRTPAAPLGLALLGVAALALGRRRSG